MKSLRTPESASESVNLCDMMKTICMIGAFDFTRKDTGGQPVKTRELYDGLCRRYGADKILYVETRQWKKHIFRMLWQLLKNVPKADVLVMLPAHNGLKVFSWLLQALKNKKAKLFYDVIGGWLPTVAQNDPKLLRALQKFDGIWVETSSMANTLRELGLTRVTVVPNFKTLTALKPEQLEMPATEPCRLATFSRVVEEKGITDAIETVAKVNAQLERTAYILDIYGPVAPQYTETFEQLQQQFGEFVTYKGVADPSESVQILKDYYALLFPTKFYTEGIPGTIIDAYCAGVPVITARWLNHADVFDEGVTGRGYSFGKIEELEQLLLELAENPGKLTAMKTNCLQKAEQYMPQTVIEQIAKLIGA